MRKNLVILSFVAICALFSSFALAGVSPTMRIHVPFDFYAGDQQLPAGEYVFQMGSGLVDKGSMVTVRRTNGEGICLLLTQPGTDHSDGKAFFNKYGNRHFLAGVAIQGSSVGMQRMKLEKELSAQAAKDLKTVTIAQR